MALSHLSTVDHCTMLVSLPAPCSTASFGSVVWAFRDIPNSAAKNGVARRRAVGMFVTGRGIE